MIPIGRTRQYRCDVATAKWGNVVDLSDVGDVGHSGPTFEGEVCDYCGHPQFIVNDIRDPKDGWAFIIVDAVIRELDEITL